MSGKPTPATASAPLGGSGSSGGGSIVHWVKGNLAWLVYQGIGLVVGLPLMLKLLVQLITNPRRTLHRKDRNQTEYPDPLPGLTHEWIETEPDVKIHAVRTGKGSGKPLLLFVHGFPEFWFSWKHQLEAFRKDYEAVAIDLRGYGQSSKPEGRDAYRMSCLAGDVNAVAQHLLKESGQKQLVLAGHDWGGNICWAAAYLAPHLYRRLAILAVPHPRCYFANMNWDQFRRSWQARAACGAWLQAVATLPCRPAWLQMGHPCGLLSLWPAPAEDFSTLCMNLADSLACPQPRAHQPVPPPNPTPHPTPPLDLN